MRTAQAETGSSQGSNGSNCPPVILAELSHADCLARALEALVALGEPSEPSYVWMLGRSDEIRAFIAQVMVEWREGRLDTGLTRDAMAAYLAGLHVTLEQWFGRWYYPSCCGPYGQLTHDEDAHDDHTHAEPGAPAASEVRLATSNRRYSLDAETLEVTVATTDAPRENSGESGVLPASKPIDGDEPTGKIREMHASGIDPNEQDQSVTIEDVRTGTG
jgi:hypothetical protein